MIKDEIGYPHVIDEETESRRRLSNFTKINRARIQTHAA